MIIRELLLTKVSRRRRGKKLKKQTGVTIHNVGNNSVGANADANARYQRNSQNEAVNGWHYTVDEKEAILSIPIDEIAEHSGKRLGNDTTVAIEICDNIDGDSLQATNNGAKIAADILVSQGHNKAIWNQNIFQHNDWSGKNCPEQIRKGNPYNWEEFVKRVNEYMAPSKKEPNKDFIKQFVSNLYVNGVERNPDPKGLEDWINAIINGSMTPYEVAYNIFFSDEALKKKAPNQEFVERVYKGVLMRSIDPTGTKTWLDGIYKDKSRVDILQGVANSNEFKEIVSKMNI